MSAAMDTVVKLKRPVPVCYEHCIICQEVKSDKTYLSSEQGLATLREATHARHKLKRSKIQG